MPTLKQTLVDANLYDRKLDHQIALATQLKGECIALRKEIKTGGYLIDGPKGKVANPLIASLQKAESLLQSAYTALGLTFAIKPDNLQRTPPTSGDAIQELLEL